MKAIRVNKSSFQRIIYILLTMFLIALAIFTGYMAGFAANSKQVPQTTKTSSQRALNEDKYAKCIEDANNPFEHQLLKNNSRSEKEYTQKIEQEISDCGRYE